MTPENYKKCVGYVNAIYQELKQAKKEKDYIQIMILTAKNDAAKGMLEIVCKDRWQSEKNNIKNENKEKTI